MLAQVGAAPISTPNPQPQPRHRTALHAGAARHRQGAATAPLGMLSSRPSTGALAVCARALQDSFYRSLTEEDRANLPGKDRPPARRCLHAPP